VDQSGIISSDVTVEGIEFSLVPFADETAARASLDAGEIEVYFVLPEDYTSFGAISIYTYRDLPSDFERDLRRLIVGNISAQAGLEMPIERILTPVNDMEATILDSGRTLNTAGFVFTFLAPFFFSILFWIAMQSTGNFLMNGLVEEKKNRIIEVLVTSVTPGQLLLGKILGLGGLGLTQVGVWLGLAFFALTLGPQIEFLQGLGNIQLPSELIITGLVFFSLGYIFNASLLATVGVLAGNEQQSNQYSALIMLPGYLAPIILFIEFVNDANGSIPTLLSMIPISAPLSMVMRMGYGAVPIEQLALSLGILIISTIIVSWISGRLFRWGLLLYGKKLNLRELLRVVTSRNVTYATSATLSETKGAEA
jgi:ABC-2 type transport system permease protein